MDPEDICIDRLLWSPVVLIVVLCFGTLVSFVISYSNGYVSIYLPFISETGAHVPSSNIFSLTLIFGSIAGALVISYKYLITEHSVTRSDPRLKHLNKASFVVGLISMAGLSGVAAFPMVTVLWAHLLAAGIHFSCAVIYIILQTILHYYVPGKSVMRDRLRWILGLMIILNLILLIIFFPISHFKWKEAHSHAPARKTPADQYFGILFSSCLFEWLMYGAFLAYMSTYFFEFRNFHVSVQVSPIAAKEIAQESQSTSKEIVQES